MALETSFIGVNGMVSGKQSLVFVGFIVCALTGGAMLGAGSNRLLDTRASAAARSSKALSSVVQGSHWENLRKLSHRARTALPFARADLDNSTVGKVTRAEEIEAAENISRAFVFIKPHAVTEKVKTLVRAKFEQEGISVISEGEVAAETIDTKNLIDIHYGPIASRATKHGAEDIFVSPKAQEEFQKVFKISWNDAVQQGLVFNAKAGAAKLGITPEKMGVTFKELKAGREMLKLGVGFYIGKVGNIFVINGFYFLLRSRYTMPGTSICYFEVAFPAEKLSWANFRSRVIGATQPWAAKKGSLRNTIFRDWKRLGLGSQPGQADNSVHASASPFEALSERSNWLGVPLTQDPFGKAMYDRGLPLKTIRYWTRHRHIVLPYQGKLQSLIDLLQDLDPKPCLDTLAALYAYEQSLDKMAYVDWG